MKSPSPFFARRHQGNPDPAIRATLTRGSLRPIGSLLAESLRWCRASAERFRASCQFAATSHLEVAADITSDCIAASEAQAAAAHAAETHSREAIRLLDAVLADGRVDRSELSHLRRARALTVRSAELDHDVSEASTLQT